MNYLPKEEWLHLAPKHSGTTRHLHNTTYCNGGSKSLKIERKENGDIDAICFRCGKSGKHSVSVYRKQRIEEALTGGVHSYHNKQSEYREIGTSNTNNWPTEASLYFLKGGIRPSEASRHGWEYSKTLARLTWPLQGGNGWLSRKVFDYDEAPKELRYYKDKTLNTTLLTHKDTEVLVIVEDLLSAMKINRQYNVLCLHGTNLTQHGVTNVLKYNKYCVWLDNDNAIVKQKQLKIHKKLQQLGESVLILTEKDPKMFSNKEIKDLVERNND